MTRMSKKLKNELAFILNDRGRHAEKLPRLCSASVGAGQTSTGRFELLRQLATTPPL